jgi:hypothetical protein
MKDKTNVSVFSALHLLRRCDRYRRHNVSPSLRHNGRKHLRSLRGLRRLLCLLHRDLEFAHQGNLRKQDLSYFSLKN